MKKIIYILTLMPIFAFACPDLSGVFQCITSSDYTFKSTIKLTEVDGNTQAVPNVMKLHR